MTLSCSQGQTEIPREVLTHDEMVNLMIDVHLLEAKVKKLYLKQDTAQTIYNHFLDSIYSQNNTSQEQYEKSLEFYLDEVGLYKDIYDEVVDSLLARQSKKDFH